MRHFILVCIFSIASITGNAQCWKQVSAGYDYALALATDGTIWGWGAGGARLGNGDSPGVFKPMPIKIGQDNDWKFVTTSDEVMSFGIKNDGTLWSWGWNYYDILLGVDTSLMNCYRPLKVGTASDWKFVDCGIKHCLGIKSNGALYGWGRNHWLNLTNTVGYELIEPLQIDSSGAWMDAACGNSFSICIKEDSTMWAVGFGYFDGSLGLGSNAATGHFEQIGTSHNWVNVECNGRNCAAVNADGELYVWGFNNGDLGAGHNDTISVPLRIGQNIVWKDVRLGTDHIVALAANGELYVSGDNMYGQYGFSQASSQVLLKVPSMSNIIGISAGAKTTIAVQQSSIISTGQYLNIDTTFIKNLEFSEVTGCYPLNTAKVEVPAPTIVPNPVVNEFAIYPQNGDNYDVAVYSATGSLILKQKTHTSVNVAALLPGVYFVVIKANDKSFIEKVVKE
jgi:alpha-tubulin suppressor-like RCC1 family protein